MKTIGVAPNSQKFLQVSLPTDQYGGFIINYTGVTYTSIDLTGLDLGSVQLVVGGVPKINIPAYYLNQINNLYLGYPTYTHGTAAAYNVIVYVPVSMWWDSLNILDVVQNENTYFRLDFPLLAVTTQYASGQVEISAIHQTGIQMYLHKILPWSLSIPGNSSLLTNPPINDTSITQVYIMNPSVLAQIQFQRNGNVIDNDTESVLLGESDLFHNIESSAGIIAKEFVPSRLLADTTSGQVQFNITSASNSSAVTLAMYYSALEWTNAKAQASFINAKANIARRGM